LLARDFDPLRLARVYAENGAAAISVLTDERYFGGHLDHLGLLANQTWRPPLLRKDFLCDPYQLYQTRAAGADAVLLIVAALPPSLLAELHALARQLGMAALMEVHTAAELEFALACCPALVGINNRNLRDFTVTLETTAALAPLVPAHVCLVAESGIHTAEDVARLAEVPRPGGGRGVDALLVGEALVTATDVAAKVRSLSGSDVLRSNDFSRLTKVKICGITTLNDALAAVEAGADLLGFNFYPPSPRFITTSACARLCAALRARAIPVTTVGVFVNTPPADIQAILDECGLDLAQLHGDEPPEDLAALGGRAFKAIRPASLPEARAAVGRYGLRKAPPALLVDTAAAGAYGGTGQAGDWAMARPLAAEHPLLLAGGLRPENVAAAVAQVRPWGVDVASGVEVEPGRKDPAKMRAFVRAVRDVEKRQ
jgi:indole-3-glycerol phosphate synthase/phosphoribosylanthranilate isomerase